MAADEGLNVIFREALCDVSGVEEKKMMGGTCFMVNGHMLGGAHREKDGTGYFMFRVGKQNSESAGGIGHGKVMEQGGRVMSGLYLVEADDCPDDVFESWKTLALSHVLSLPSK